MPDCLDSLHTEIREQLITSLYSKRAFFWIGSGFSRNFGYPSWTEVIEAAKRQLGYTGHIEMSNPLRAAEILCAHARQQGKSEKYFNTIVLSSLETERKTIFTEPTWKADFIEICPEVVVTTNCDNVLEDVFDNFVNVVVRGDTAPQISNVHRNIFKIHGDFRRPNSIVVTRSQYNSFQRENTYLSRKVYTLFSEGNAIFIGYSLSDPNVAFLYDEAFAHIGAQKSPSFMVVRSDTPDADMREAELLFRQKNIFIVRADIAEFLQACMGGVSYVRDSIAGFQHEIGTLEPRIRDMVKQVSTRFGDWASIGRDFRTHETATKALSSIKRFFADPTLYREYGGSVLSPSSSIDYNEAHGLSQIAIHIGNRIGNFPLEISELVIEHAISGPNIWDFNKAGVPFLDLLTVHPTRDSRTYLK